MEDVNVNVCPPTSHHHKNLELIEQCSSDEINITMIKHDVVTIESYSIEMEIEAKMGEEKPATIKATTASVDSIDIANPEEAGRASCDKKQHHHQQQHRQGMLPEEAGELNLFDEIDGDYDYYCWSSICNNNNNERNSYEGNVLDCDDYEFDSEEEEYLDFFDQYEDDCRGVSVNNFHKLQRRNATDHVRSKAKNKKEKITRFNVNGPRYAHAEQRQELLLENYEKQKQNGLKRLGPNVQYLVINYLPATTSHNYYGGSSGNNNSSNRRIRDEFILTEEEQLAIALAESAKEYQRTTSNNTGVHHTLSVAELTAQLRDIQHRELTPEDYELLLLLDASVKPKTIPKHKVESLPCFPYNAPPRRQKPPTCEICVGSEACEHCSSGGSIKEEDEDEEDFEVPVCSICICEFEEDQMVKLLPCGHTFHAECIDTWLTTSSVNCPVDKLAVEI